MRRLFLLSAAVLAVLFSSSALSRTEAAGQAGVAAGTSHQALLTTYCYSCHNVPG